MLHETAKSRTIKDIAFDNYANGDLSTALRICQQALEIKTDDPEMLHLAGLIHFREGRMAQAIEYVSQAVKNDCRNVNYLNTLGVVLKSAGRIDEALTSFKRAISFNPTFSGSFNNLGLTLFQTGRLKGAIACYRKAIRLESRCDDAYYNLGIALKKKGCLNESLSVFSETIRVNPAHFKAFNNIGGIYLIRGDIDRAYENFRTAIQINPDFAAARMNLALTLFLKGDLPGGWQEYEWRFKLPGKMSIYPHHYTRPRWDGSSFKGKTLLVHDEQGFGDTIQFIRYLPLVKALGGHVVFETRKPLVPLFKNFPGIDTIVERSQAPRKESEFDLYIPLMSLPLVFNTSIDTIPRTCPYIFSNEEKSKKWRNRFDPGRPRIGIVWRGSPSHSRDQDRSIPLPLLTQLIRLSKLSFYGLQKNQDDSAPLVEIDGIFNLGDELNDFSDTAAVIENLDLVVSVDTAVAHLAGAMGKTVWTLLPYSPDWRWGMKTTDSRWYPSMTLFRQPAPGDWKSVIDRVAFALIQYTR